MVLLIILTIVLVISVLPIGSGSTGIRPKTHGCLGITLEADNVHRFFPSARIDFLSFSYNVVRDRTEYKHQKYCLGKDIWYGE